MFLHSGVTKQRVSKKSGYDALLISKQHVSKVTPGCKNMGVVDGCTNWADGIFLHSSHVAGVTSLSECQTQCQNNNECADFQFCIKPKTCGTQCYLLKAGCVPMTADPNVYGAENTHAMRMYAGAGTGSTPCPEATCTTPESTGYYFSGEEGSKTIDGFAPTGVKCAIGYTGKVVYKECRSAGTEYTVSGCKATCTTPESTGYDFSGG